jgi:hypothetical protein
VKKVRVIWLFFDGFLNLLHYVWQDSVHIMRFFGILPPPLGQFQKDLIQLKKAPELQLRYLQVSLSAAALL